MVIAPSSAPRIHARTCTLRIAICISGKPKVLVQPRMREHLRAVLRPLIDSGSTVCTDTYLHLQGWLRCRSSSDPCERVLRSAAEELQARSLVIYRGRSRLHIGTHSLATPQICLTMCLGGKRFGSNRQPCTSAGYETAVKLRGCLRQIEEAEAAAGVAYQFVLRLRPDIEHLRSLPAAAEWRCLRPDTAYVMIVLPPPHKTKCYPGHARLGKRQALTVETPNLFVDDNLALLPRHAAQTYFSIADGFEQCVRTTRVNELCQKRWEWPECRVTQALASAGGLRVAELPSTVDGFAIIDCMWRQRPNQTNKTCKWQRRANANRHISERRLLHKQPFLSTRLNVSSFAPDNLASCR